MRVAQVRAPVVSGSPISNSHPVEIQPLVHFPKNDSITLFMKTIDFGGASKMASDSFVRTFREHGLFKREARNDN